MALRLLSALAHRKKRATTCIRVACSGRAGGSTASHRLACGDNRAALTQRQPNSKLEPVKLRGVVSSFRTDGDEKLRKRKLQVQAKKAGCTLAGCTVKKHKRARATEAQLHQRRASTSDEGAKGGAHTMVLSKDISSLTLLFQPDLGVARSISAAEPIQHHANEGADSTSSNLRGNDGFKIYPADKYRIRRVF